MKKITILLLFLLAVSGPIFISPCRAEPLDENPTLSTAPANDFNYHDSYVYKVRNKLKDGRLGPFSVAIGSGSYGGSFDDLSLIYSQNVYDLYLGYKKELFTHDLTVFYFKPGLQYNTDADGTQINSLNADFGMDIYEIEGFTMLAEVGLNYAFWQDTLFKGMGSNVGLNFNFGGYATDNFIVGMKISLYRGIYPPKVNGTTDYLVTHVQLYLEVR